MFKFNIRMLPLLLSVVWGGTAQARLQVAATVPNMGMLVREIGGEAVQVQVMSPPDRNAHYLEARPRMMTALRRADLVVSVGAELEIGWLPAALQGANNPRVQVGRRGYFEATQGVALMGVSTVADRALGDVHPQGNPHIYMDPERMAAAGFLLAERLAELDPARSDYFLANAQRFADTVQERMAEWRRRAEGAPGIVTYHEDIDYLVHALGIPVWGHVEPLPGIPPTARHLSALVGQLTGKEGVVWTVDFQPAEGGRFVAEQLGWAHVHLPSQVSVQGTMDDYFSMIDAWVSSLE